MKKIIKNIVMNKIYICSGILILIIFISINFSFVNNTNNEYIEDCGLNSNNNIFFNKDKLDSVTKMNLNESMNKVHFIPNKGQWNCNILYASMGMLYDIIVYNNYISIVSKNKIKRIDSLEINKISNGEEKHIVNLFFEGGNDFIVQEGKKINTDYNWFMNEKNVTNINPVNELILKELYRGIDLRLYSNKNGSLEFDWIINSGANYKNIKMRCEGQDQASVLEDGSLNLSLKFSRLNFKIPEVYQIDSKNNRVIKCAAFKIRDNISTFEIDDIIDPSLPLIIDPVLKWGSFFDAPNFWGYLYGGVKDASDNLYMAGSSENLLGSSSVFSGAIAGYISNPLSPGGTTVGTNWLILKSSPNAASIISYTFFGFAGPVNEQAHCISVSPSGNRVFVGGYVNGGGFIPVTSIVPFGANSTSGAAPCVIVLDNSLTNLIYSTLIGGPSNSILAGVTASGGRSRSDITSIEALNDDTFIIGGYTTNPLGNGSVGGTIPYMNGADNTHEGNEEMFLLKFNNLNIREWGSYIGGNQIDRLHDFRITSSGDIAFVGSSNSTTNFTNIINAVNTTLGTGNEFVIGVLKSDGTAFNTLSKFGGNGEDEFIGLTTKFSGELFASGSTNSTNIGILGTSPSSVIQSTYGGVGSDLDFFLYRCKDIGGTSGSFGTYFGGPFNEVANSIEVLPSGGGSLLIFGTSWGPGTPTINNIAGNTWFQNTSNGSRDMFFLACDLNFNSVSLATYVGGGGDDYVGSSPITGRHMSLLDTCTLALFTTTHSASHLPSVISSSGVLDNVQSNGGQDSWLFFALNVCDIIAGQVVLNCCDSVIIYKTDSCCSHLESTCEIKSINISVANGTISDLFWNCGTIPPGYLGSTNFTYTPTTACPLALDLCVNADGLNPVTVTYTITFIDSSICVKTETKNCPCAYVSGELWHDIDNDGIHETLEPALVGYTVNLIDCATGIPLMFMPTAPITGAYSFSCMPPGKYYVQFVPPSGYEPSPFNTSGPTTDSDIDHINGTYNTDIFIVNNGDTIQNLDAGLFNCCDFVIIENTNDSCCSTITSLCAVDSIKVNVQNGTISLISWNCAPRLNNYYATGLSDFTLGIPSGCPLSFGVCVDPIYTNPYAPVIITYTVYSSSGAVCTKYDTLYCPCAVITGEAWYDANGDGIYQQIENGINGMLIQLVDAMTGKTVSTMETITRPGTSSDDGYYEFPCVKPGMYYIRFDSLAGFTTSTPFQGGNAETDSDITGTYGPYTTYKITVMNGDTINNIDGGYKDSSLISSAQLTIAGLITVGPNKAMLSSKVLLSTATNPFYRSTWSHYSGNYAFYDLTSGQDYRISIENDEVPLEGVTTMDIILIQKHILGIKSLDSPYKIIAADVNNSQSITASDIAEIRKLILGVIESFPKNKSWRFVPKNYVFKNNSSPFPFEEHLLHSKMENSKMNSDFYAIKIGDVSGNALGLVNSTIRSVKDLKLIFEKENYKKNEEISIKVRLSESHLLNGIQMALKISDDLEFIAIENGSIGIHQENYRFNRGHLLISYNDAQGFELGKEDIFTLRVKAKTDLNINRKITTSEFIETEAYDLDDQVVPLVLNSVIEQNKLDRGYKFYTAKPNPFKQETLIEFELPETEQLNFTVFNPDGKMIWRKETVFPKGHNQINLSKQELGNPGLYHLHIHSNGVCKSQRILLIE